jgi:hypothetical protein
MVLLRIIERKTEISHAKNPWNVATPTQMTMIENVFFSIKLEHPVKSTNRHLGICVHCTM